VRDASVQPPPAALLSQLWRFGAIGAASTLGYLGLCWLLSSVTSTIAANAAALLTMAAASTTANRRLTFGASARAGLARDQVAGLATAGLALALTTACAALLQLAAPAAARPLQLAVLMAAGAPASLARFAFLRAWPGRPARRRHAVR